MLYSFQESSTGFCSTVTFRFLEAYSLPVVVECQLGAFRDGSQREDTNALLASHSPVETII